MTWLIWVWIGFCVLDTFGGVLGWLELRKEEEKVAMYLSHILLASGYRSSATIAGLAVFGLNAKVQLWYVVLGISAVGYKAYATWGWLLYSHSILSDGGWRDLFRRRR